MNQAQIQVVIFLQWPDVKMGGIQYGAGVRLRF